jgi:endonuclease/exonuclease/phosphatase (EEP) superfamily protein YafD
VLVLTLVGIFTLYSIGQWLLNGRVWWWELLAFIPPIMIFIALGILWGLVLYNKYLPGVIILIICTFFWAPQLDVDFVPGVNYAASGDTLNVFNWNTEYWASTEELPELISFLKAQNADIYQLQEGFNALLQIEDTITPLQEAFPEYNFVKSGEFLTFTKYEVLTYSEADAYFPWGIYLRTDIQIDGSPLSLYNVHLPIPVNIYALPDINSLLQSAQEFFPVRQQAMDALMHDLRNNPNRVLISGDFNSTRLQQIMTPMLTLYVDAFSAANSGYPTTIRFGPLRLWRIDWVFGSEIRFHSYQEIHPQGLSDHQGILVSFSLN